MRSEPPPTQGGTGIPITTCTPIPHHVFEMEGLRPSYLAVLEALIYFNDRPDTRRSDIIARARVGLTSYLNAVRWLKQHGVIGEVEDRVLMTGRRFVLLWTVERRASDGH